MAVRADGVRRNTSMSVSSWRSRAEASEDDDELVVADLDLALIDEVRQTWQFYRDRRPEAYDELVEF